MTLPLCSTLPFKRVLFPLFVLLSSSLAYVGCVPANFATDDATSSSDRQPSIQTFLQFGGVVFLVVTTLLFLIWILIFRPRQQTTMSISPLTRFLRFRSSFDYNRGEDITMPRIGSQHFNPHDQYSDSSPLYDNMEGRHSVDLHPGASTQVTGLGRDSEHVL